MLIHDIDEGTNMDYLMQVSSLEFDTGLGYSHLCNPG